MISFNVLTLRSTPMVSSEELQKLSRTQDPFQLVERDIYTLSGGIKDLLGSDHPVLATCAK